MKRQFVLTVAESKRLIAKGVAALPEVMQAMEERTVVVATGDDEPKDTYSFAPTENPGDTLTYSIFDLPLEALPAWQIYCEMGQTKRDHFELLCEINERREQSGAEPSLAESVKLEELLKQHDHKVKAFRHVMQENSQPQPHQGHSICGGNVTRPSPQEQWDTTSSLAFRR